MAAGFASNATDRNLRAWLTAGAVDQGIGDGLTFMATVASASQGKALWVLRFRFGGRQREKVLGRYPDISLKEARELARKDRALLQQGVDIAAVKRPLKDIDRFTVHDMRRTARTHMAALSVNRFVAERALNHKIRDVEGIYDQHDYFAERKEALARWALLVWRRRRVYSCPQST
jgi:integrase